MATYLGLINKVMVELREPVVTDITGEFARLVGQKVNQAKRDVEAATQWSYLRTEIDFVTVVGQQDYTMTGTNARSILAKDPSGRAQVFNITTSVMGRLREMPREYHRADIAWNLASNSVPSLFSLRRTPTTITLSLYPKPDAVYSMRAVFYIPQVELSATSDVISVPEEPVYLLAAAYVAAERGDGSGTMAQELAAAGQKALIEAINFDREAAELTAFEA
ncbi:MAG: hypothetical protein AB7Q37_18605 [Pyrinomonadaceae bacterium]